MTPDELELIAADGLAVRSDAEGFATTFYDTLFAIAPETRQLFPDDLVEQRGKLVDELTFLVEAATARNDDQSLERFTERASDLGRRHAGYGVTGADYEPVCVALIAALRRTVDDWGDVHEQAWTKLYRLISGVMRDGAAAQVGGESARATPSA